MSTPLDLPSLVKIVESAEETFVKRETALSAIVRDFPGEKDESWVFHWREVVNDRRNSEERLHRQKLECSIG